MSAGCGFLSSAELEAAIDGRLDQTRTEDFDRHVEAGCAECVTLAADLRVFQAVVHDGALAGESREADRQAEMLRVRLAREVRKPRSALRWRGWALAAAALLVAGLVWIGTEGPAAPDGLSIRLPGGQVLIAEAKPFDKPPVLRGQPELEEAWTAAEAAYTSGRFSAAERHLAEILDRRPDSFDALVYRGVCLLALERFDGANASFEEARRLAALHDHSTTSLAWFQALTALEEGRRTVAREYLEEAAAGAGAYAVKARELLARLGA